MARDEVVVIPDGWLSRGEAFVRGEGTQLAVFGGIPGERARVLVTDRDGALHRGRVVGTVGAPSPLRVEPECERYAICGRCPMMHLTDAGRAAALDGILADAFAGFAPAPAPLVSGTRTGFQHTLELVTGWSDERHPRLGVSTRDRRRVAPIPQCPVATQPLRDLMKVTAHQMISLDVRPWDGRSGSLRAVHARQSRIDGEIVVTLVYAKPSPFATTFAEQIAGGLPAVSGIHAHWNDDPDMLLDPGEGGVPATLMLYGKMGLEERVDGVRLRLGPLDPWPAYPERAERMWTDLVAALAPEDGDAVVDIASGIGIRTLLLARRSGWALGIDASEDLARRARESALTNGITAEFAVGATAEVLAASTGRLDGRRPLVVADTGRRGLDDADLAALVALAPRRIALLGGNPRALARDAERIAARGWSVRSVVPYDLAPHSPYVETVALLVSSDQRAPTRRAPRRKRV